MINYPKLFNASATSFVSQGLGALSDCTQAIVTEKRNGSYELEMQYPISGLHFSEIAQRSIIVAKANYYDDPQPFRVYKITKPLNGICTIYAQHISYDLNGYEIAAGTTAGNASAALAALDNAAGTFTVTGSIGGSAEFVVDVPSSVRSWFGGKKGSILDLYGGEWHFDGYTCRITTSRGANRGVTIRYGKNLISLTQEEKCANLYSAVRVYYKDAGDVVTQSDLILTGAALVPGRILFVDASGAFDETPTVAQLNTYATNYISNNNLRTPEVNLTLDWVQMQDFDRVELCDTVTVVFESLGVSATAKCIETKWNVLKDRYESIVIGDAKSSMASTISNVAKNVATTAVNTVQTHLEKTIETITEKITGNLGGYVVLHDSDNDGYPDEILIMNTPSINTATKVWRWNKNGLGYSSTGYAGPYGTAITADGEIVADFITAGKITSANGSVYFDLDNNILQCTQLQGPYISYYPSGQDAGNTRINIERRYVGNYYQCYVHIYNTKVSDKGLRLIPAGYAASSNVANYSAIESDEGADGLTLTCKGSSADQPFMELVRYDTSNPSGSGLILLQRKTNGIGIQITSSGTYVVGDFRVGGTKSREIQTDAYGRQLLYAYETPVPLFADVGEGVIGEDGLCYVWIEPIFASTINSDHYQVFLQKYGDGDCWIQERKAGYFVVKGTPDLAFGWEIKARQVDVTQKRMDNLFEYEVPSSDIGEKAAEYIYELYEGRKTA